MKTKLTSMILIVLVALASACNSGAVPVPTGSQSTQRPPPTATELPPAIFTEAPFGAAPTDTLPTTEVPPPTVGQVNHIGTDFSLSAADPIPPEDVLQEIMYYGQGVVLCTEGPYAQPDVVFIPDDQELMIQTSLTVCGWEEGEILTASVQYPDGRVKEWSFPAERDDTGFYVGKLDFQPLIDDPTGTYVYTLAGSSGSFTAEAHYRMPAGPRLFAIHEDQLFLYGFAPGESVAVYCYDATGGINPQGLYVGEFLGWQEYVVDQNGQLEFVAPLDRCNFAAVGTVSGEVHLLRYDPNSGEAGDWVQDGILKPNCGGLPSRLESGNEARVAFTDGANMRIRAQPGFAGDILTSVPEGTTVFLRQHECADGRVWWNVSTDTAEGWMTEEQNGVYLLEPIP